MKNGTAPRTLADSQFVLGHAAAEHPAHHRPSITERIAGVMLAVVIGVVLAAALFHWAAQP
jgi:hypothetical protein